MTVQKDGEAALGLSPKRFAKQYAATIADQYAENEQIPGRVINCILMYNIIDDSQFTDWDNNNNNLNQPRMTVPLIQGTLRYAFYKKTKVSACGAPGAA